MFQIIRQQHTHRQQHLRCCFQWSLKISRYGFTSRSFSKRGRVSRISGVARKKIKTGQILPFPPLFPPLSFRPRRSRPLNPARGSVERSELPRVFGRSYFGLKKASNETNLCTDRITLFHQSQMKRINFFPKQEEVLLLFASYWLHLHQWKSACLSARRLRCNKMTEAVTHNCFDTVWN